MDIETIAAIIFLAALTIFVYLKRKSLDTKHIIPNILYFSMYRTSLGLKSMDYFAKKYRKFMAYLGYFGVFICFLGMALISYSLLDSIYNLFTEPEAAPGVGLVLPFKARGVFFVPFFYWIIAIFVIAVVHEFAHGLIARTHNLKVKSSGFAFLGLIVPIIPAAFVEPDEKKLRTRPHKEQLSVFAAGPFSNILFALLFFAIASFVISPLAVGIIEANGVKITDYVDQGPFPAEKAGIKIGELVQKIDNQETPYVENLSNVLKNKKPGDVVSVKTDKSTYRLTLAKNPENESLAYMGAYLEQSTKVKDNVAETYGTFLPNALIWVYGLVIILFLLNLGVGLFNLVPIGPLDGGRMLQLPLHKYFGEEKGNRIWGYIGLFFLAIIFINIAAGFGLFKLF